MIRIVQRNGHIGKPQRLSALSTGKNNIFHPGTAQLLGTLFTKYPAHGICYVTLSAAVRPYNPRNAFMKLKHHLIGKGFKALHLYTF